ncbi:hypothetical protein CYMTET_17298 [Cymbomonas tetramitiformis]|uniref:Uncharacterized protein n=1 Tax=Cymbomonas tetramitiformis TaxID=36881 RepID=A0AAE0GBT2_9CHLO|nr:hypothetical protein CYMTET_17298 [Cymbomonas tetramitiformis]
MRACTPWRVKGVQRKKRYNSEVHFPSVDSIEAEDKRASHASDIERRNLSSGLKEQGSTTGGRYGSGDLAMLGRHDAGPGQRLGAADSGSSKGASVVSRTVASKCATAIPVAVYSKCPPAGMPRLCTRALFDMTGTYTISFTIAAGACIAASLSAFLLQDSDVILESLKEAEQND